MKKKGCQENIFFKKICENFSKCQNKSQFFFYFLQNGLIRQKKRWRAKLEGGEKSIVSEL